MAKINTIANNGLTIVENYNKLLEQFRKTKTIDDVRILVASVRDFISLYKRVDKNMVNEIYEKLQSKLQDMIAENAFVYDRMNNRVEEIRNRAYDYANEKDDTQAVQAKLLQLMANMPKVYNDTNANRITKELNDCINSGVVGSKAVLELLKYPAYADRVSTAVRERAFEGSKSPAQKAFENGNTAQLRENEQALASVYIQGFHLRNIAKQVTAFKKPSAWNPENEAV
jgi:regulator of replication initiation timing